MKLRVAIIGLGQIGMTSDIDLNHADHVYSHARAFRLHPAFELVAGVDSNAERRDRFERAYDCPAYAEIDETLKQSAPEVVVIAVPTALHLPVLKRVMAFCRPRAVLCEKPLSYELSEASEIVELCEQAGCLLYVNYVRRADPAVRQIKNMMDDGIIERPIKGLAWYSKGLFNNGSHFVDLLQYWLGEMQTFHVTQKGRSQKVDPEPDVLISFADAQIQMLAAREEDFSYYMIELISPSGRLRYDLGGENVSWQPIAKSVTSPGYTVLDPLGTIIENDLSHIQSHVADQLHRSLCGQAAAICSGRDALRTIEFLHSIKKTL